MLIQIFRPESLVLVLWVVQFGRLAWAGPWLEGVGAVVAALFLLRVSVRLRRATVILCGALTVLAAVLVLAYGGLSAALAGLRTTPLFTAFFGTIVLLRVTADQLQQIVNARELFERLKPDQRLGGFLVGSHVLASVLGPGAFAITAPIVGESKVEAEHLAAMRACHRGGSLAGLWSPFWIAMALSSQYVPGVPLWQIMTLGLSMAALALTGSHLLFSRERGLGLLWRALRSLQPIVPPVALCVVVVALLSGATVLSTLEALIAGVPALCLLTLLPKGRRALGRTLALTYRGSADIGNEVTILTLSLALGGVVRHVFAQTGIMEWMGALDLPAMAVIALVIGGGTVSSLVGVHQIVSLTFLLTVLSNLPLQVADVVLMESALVSWSCASMVGLSAILVATASTMFRVPPERVILGPNLAFVALFATGAILVLTGVNALLR
ncbi:MAG: hypothetical protein OXF11_16340 [Deltaproteobacteria bacterium]|nr:hypothetical protein [Deltaproteobacteria bacterium]